MTTSDWIRVAGITFGLFATTIASTIVLAFKIGIVHEKVMSMEKTLNNLGTVRIPSLELMMAQITVKLEVLWKGHIAESNSPLTLNEDGLRALEASNIGPFIESQYPEILKRVKLRKPGNAYQAQEILISVLKEYGQKEEYKLKLQDAAYASGQDVDSLMLVAALMVRDRVIIELELGGPGLLGPLTTT